MENNNSTGNLSGPAALPSSMEPFGLRVFRLSLYTMIFLIATIGNSLVIFVVYKTHELRTVTGYLIVNLAIADFGVGLVCIPFTLVYFELKYVWIFGNVMCKVVPFMQALFLMGSVATMIAISVDRHQSICNPFDPRVSISQCKLIILLTWLVAMILALPMIPVNNQVFAKGADRCTELWPGDTDKEKESYGNAYMIGSFLLTWAIPLPIIIALYIKIGLKLREAMRDAADRPGFRAAQATNKIIRMLLAVVICYALCFLPLNIINIVIYMGKLRNPLTRLIQSYAQVIMYFNSASNPILYAFLGDQFRAGFRKAVGLRTSKDRSIQHTLITTT